MDKQTWFDRLLPWMDRLGVWPVAVSIALVIAGYAAGVAATVTSFPLWAQFSIYAGSAILIGFLVLKIARWYLRGRVDVTSRYFSRQRVYIVDLVRNQEVPVLRERVFEDCEILGPAILHPTGSTQFLHSGFRGSMEGTFYDVSGPREASGVIAVDSCVFRRCHFVRIGIIGPPDLRRAFLSAG